MRGEGGDAMAVTVMVLLVEVEIPRNGLTDAAHSLKGSYITMGCFDTVHLL